MEKYVIFEFEIKVSSKKSRKTVITSPNIKLYHAS